MAHTRTRGLDCCLKVPKGYKSLSRCTEVLRLMMMTRHLDQAVRRDKLYTLFNSASLGPGALVRLKLMGSTCQTLTLPHCASLCRWTNANRLTHGAKIWKRSICAVHHHSYSNITGEHVVSTHGCPAGLRARDQTPCAPGQRTENQMHKEFIHTSWRRSEAKDCLKERMIRSNRSSTDALSDSRAVVIDTSYSNV